VCLLIKSPPGDPKIHEAVRKAGEAAGIPSAILDSIIGHEDKCKRMVDNPDQPFCDGCEEDGHHLLPNQLGMQNIHLRGNNT
jgi:hypothetical protein